MLHFLTETIVAKDMLQTTFFIGLIMQRKLLLLGMIVGYTAMYGVPKLENIEARLAEEIGSLGSLIEHMNEDELKAIEVKKATQLLIVQRALIEKRIHDYKQNTKKDFERALVEEFSGKDKAVEIEFQKLAQANKEEVEKLEKIQSDAVLGYFAAQPTDKSRTGQANKLIRVIKSKKDEIIQSNCNLVVNNKNTILSTLKNELDEKVFFMKKYAYALQHYGKDAKRFQENGLNLEAALNDSHYFNNLAQAAFFNTVEAAQKMGITVAMNDMVGLADKNKDTATLAKELVTVREQAEKTRNGILNPQPVTPPLDLTGEDKDKHSIFSKDENPKENQDDQGALSQ